MRRFRVFAAFCALLVFLAGCSENRGESSLELSRDSGEAAPSLSSSVSAEQGEPVRATAKLTVPEGYTLPRIGMTLEELGICTASEFISAAREIDIGMYAFLAEREGNANRCYPLEGYLFPDTYEIYLDEQPEDIIRRMLDNFAVKAAPLFPVASGEDGFAADEILALASIIEKEAFGREHMPSISSVLHNRLEIRMRLQCDVTINYVEGAVKPFITGDTDRYSEFYNTYKCPGIPAGPICNPGLDAIMAAINPGDTGYLFFVTDDDKNYYFSETWEGHEENIAAIKSRKAAA